MPTRRRDLLKALLAGGAAVPLRRAWAGAPPAGTAHERLSALERRWGGRLGVSILATGTGQRVSHRGDERFPLCSTFKFLAAAQVLAAVDQGSERLDRRIEFGEDDLVPYSPVTGNHVGPPGMTLAELCHAAVTLSDNTAANLMLAGLGGPDGVTAFARSLGDTATRLDRIEPHLNEARPGDPRDTTTPAAMLEDMRVLLLGEVLSPTSRAQLAEWLVATTTGAGRLRAGLPRDWRVGDKTGTGGHGATNDIAVAWPPEGDPLLVSAYYAESDIPQEDRNGVLAEVGRIAASP